MMKKKVESDSSRATSLSLSLLCLKRKKKKIKYQSAAAAAAMASVQTLDVEVELKSPADKVWTALRDSTTLFPKAFPDQYKSIEVLEGDGKSVGSVRLINYADGISSISTSKEKIEKVEEEKRAASAIVVGGDLPKYYSHFKSHFVVVGKGDEGGCVVKWSCEYEKTNEEIPIPHLIRDFAVKNFQDLDAYIQAGNQI